MTKKVLFISQDVLADAMAGPGIRHYQLARVLARQLDVTIAVPNLPPRMLAAEGVRFQQFDLADWATLEPSVRAADVCVLPSDIVTLFPALAASGVPLVIDGYTPLLAEYLAHWTSLPLEEQNRRWAGRMINLMPQYTAGDFFVCASERQRDWWLGQLEAHGRVNPLTLHDDASLRRLVDVVPYGLSSEPLHHSRPVVRGVWPGIGPEDKILLWGGGLWPWLDPLTAVRAVGRLWPARQDLRLIFPGTRHPNPAMSATPTHTEAARRLAAELGLLDRGVFFGDWIAYAEWDNVLAESDIALTLHFDTLETRLAFRSRVFDYIRAGLPIVASVGDATADLVDQQHLGRCVPIGSDAAVAEAIAGLLDRPKTALASEFAAARALFTWERAAAPLLNFCAQPRRAPDKLDGAVAAGSPAVAALREQLAAVEKVVAAYEQGRFMRAMRTLDRLKQQLVPGLAARTRSAGQNKGPQ